MGEKLPKLKPEDAVKVRFSDKWAKKQEKRRKEARKKVIYYEPLSDAETQRIISKARVAQIRKELEQAKKESD